MKGLEGSDNIMMEAHSTLGNNHRLKNIHFDYLYHKRGIIKVKIHSVKGS